jgi:hypothetical protein
VVAQKAVETALEEIVARGVQQVLGDPEDKLAQKAGIGAGGWFHG